MYGDELGNDNNLSTVLELQPNSELNWEVNFPTFCVMTVEY